MVLNLLLVVQCVSTLCYPNFPSQLHYKLVLDRDLTIKGTALFLPAVAGLFLLVLFQPCRWRLWTGTVCLILGMQS